MYDKIMAPLGRVSFEMIPQLQRLAFRNFYTGIDLSLIKNDWDFSLSHHYHPSGCNSPTIINDILRTFTDKKLNITFNSFYYTPLTVKCMKMQLDTVDYSQIDHIVVGNLAVAKSLWQTFPDLSFSASSLMDIRTTEGVAHLLDLGFSRVVLPRNIEICEILSIVEEFSKYIEIEVFISGGGCAFGEGSCHLPHILQSKEFDAKMIPLCRYPIVNRETFQLDSSLNGRKGCGLCYLNLLKRHNIALFKITGRTQSINMLNKYQKYIDFIIKENMLPNVCKKRKEECLYGKITH